MSSTKVGWDGLPPAYCNFRGSLILIRADKELLVSMSQPIVSERDRNHIRLQKPKGTIARVYGVH